MAHSTHHRVLPFSAIVGQDQLKLALRMLAVDPRLGGVLIRGDKGTAKSTAARALASLLPGVRVNAGCRFGCISSRPDAWCDECRDRQPASAEERRPAFETLPLGITADQLLGTIDLEHVLREGTRRFAPGLLARVNQGALYVDEVNLLEDHLVDLLLDAAAMGVNVVAREGISITHPAEFVLIGTMNPEEGRLRPQLLDRFGLCVDVSGIADVEARAEVVSRRLAFEADPERFCSQWRGEEEAMASRLAEARRVLPNIPIERRWCVAAAEVSLDMQVQGHRADVLLVKGAATLAALAGRTQVEAEDLVEAARVVLPHRLRRRPFEEEAVSADELVARAREVVERSVEEQKKNMIRPELRHRAERAPTGSDERHACFGEHTEEPDAAGRGAEGPRGLFAGGLWSDGTESVEPVGPGLAAQTFHELVAPLSAQAERRRRSNARSRRHSQARSEIGSSPFSGQFVYTVPADGRLQDLAWLASLEAAALRQGRRQSPGGPAVRLRIDDLARKVRIRRPERLLLLVVDASGSMGSLQTALAKRVALAVLESAYVERERVAMVGFRARSAHLLFEPTHRVERVHEALRGLHFGGTTPLASGLRLAREILERDQRRQRRELCILVVTDAKANVGASEGYGSVMAEVEHEARLLGSIEGAQILFLDTTEPGKRDLDARLLAERLGAERLSLAQQERAGRDAVATIDQWLKSAKEV